MDAGYGTPNVLKLLVSNGIKPNIKAIKNENAVNVIMN